MIVLLLTLSLARAQEGDDSRARELYENGAALYEEGRYDDAIAAFEEAYRLSKRPVLLFNIANALEHLGRFEEALDVLSRYRAYAPAEEREVLDRRIGNLERRIAETKAAAAAAPPAPPVVLVVPSEPGPAPAPAAMPSLFRPLPLSVAGAGVVALGVGVAFGAGSLAAHEEASSGCAPDSGGLLRCSVASSEALSREQSSAIAGDVLMIAGALGFGGGIALGLWGEGGPLSVGPGYVAVQGRF